MTGWIDAFEGQAAAAVALCERAIEPATDPISAGYADAYLGDAHLEAGDAGAGVPRLMRAIENCRRLGFRTGEAW